MRVGVGCCNVGCSLLFYYFCIVIFSIPWQFTGCPFSFFGQTEGRWILSWVVSLSYHVLYSSGRSESVKMLYYWYSFPVSYRSKFHTYDDVVERVAQHLGLDDPTKIRLTSHNCYSQQPKPQPIKFRGVEHLSDMLVHYNQVVYYKILNSVWEVFSPS